MVKTKEEIELDLLAKAREIIKDKGLEFLTARKLSDYSGYSVGTIYNQFKSMDNLVMWLNTVTIEELYDRLERVEKTSDVYKNLNALLDKFVEFVLENKNLWFTLYNFHFKSVTDKYDIGDLRSLERKKIVKILWLLEDNLDKLFMNVQNNERTLSAEVLFVTMFSISSLLTTENKFTRINKKYLVKVLFNTYLAGMSCLAKK